MESTAREEILGKLKSALKVNLQQRPAKIPQVEISPGKDALVEQFITSLAVVSGVGYYVKNNNEALEKLTEIVKTENINNVMSSTDEMVTDLGLQKWGKENGIAVFDPSEFKDETAFKNAVFDKVDAGITGAFKAVAESGTLAMVHDKDQARLVSLAPPIHIAMIPVEKLVRYYEEVTEEVFKDKNQLPSHFTFITGSSATADIAATPTLGMHGPKKLFAILIG